MNRDKLAGLAFIACVQFFAAELICAAGFDGGYSYFRRYISDLGAVTCTLPGVCSPRHTLMNASFGLQGLLIAGGAALLWRRFAADRWARAGLIALMICALGIVIVGLAPEDVDSTPHYAGAGLHLIPCNLALLLFAQADARPPLPRKVFLVAGSLGLAGVAGSALHIYLGLGAGGMERLGAYPFLLTLIACGVALTSASAQPVLRKFPAA